MTLIFDREGWSPKRFKHWHSTGFDVITYRKGKYREWQRRAFKEVTVEVCGRKVKYLLGERLLPVAKGFRMREVRRLCDDGHQTSVVTTRRDLALETVALHVLALAAGELLPLHAPEFALDHLPTTAVEPADPLRSVPNPAVKEKRRELSRVKAELAQAEQAYGQHALENPEHETRTLREFKIIHAELGCKIEALRCEQAQRFADLKALPKRVACVRGWMARRSCSSNASARSLPTRSRWSPTAPKHSWRTWSDHCSHTATTKRASSCAKSSSYPQICSPTTREERSPCACTVWPRRDTRVLASLCGVLNDLAVCYPGTELRLVLEAQQPAPESR